MRLNHLGCQADSSLPGWTADTKNQAVFAIAFQHIYGKGVWSGAQIVRTGSVHLMGLCQFSIPDTCILRKVYQWNGDGDSRRNWWVRLDDTICCKASRSIKGTRRSCNFHKCTGINMLSVHRITLKSFFPDNASWKMKLQMKKAWETLLLSSCSKMCSQPGRIALLACKGGKSLKFLFKKKGTVCAQLGWRGGLREGGRAAVAGCTPCTPHTETLGGTTTRRGSDPEPGGAAREARPAPGTGKGRGRGRASPAAARHRPGEPSHSPLSPSQGREAARKRRASTAACCLIG